MSAEFNRVYNYSNGVKVLFSHVNDEPAMAVVRKAWGKGFSFIIGLSQAHLYTEDEYLMRQSFVAAGTLGLSTTHNNVSVIASLIQQHIEELVLLPPPQEEDTKSMVEEAVERHGLQVAINGEDALGHL